ncbi:GIY-YIG nuclease family protein [Patescibacteria group bacterium]|nr:GIY-YIG nuclease family protein [Patescibacteria group bacterium]
MAKEYYVYLMMNSRNTVIYTGLTNDLARRVWEHKHPDNPKSFTARYNVDKLVYYEVFEDIYEAIEREKQIKRWNREKKLNLIRTINPNLKELEVV